MDPLRRLKFLPWLTLTQVALLTTLSGTVLEVLLLLSRDIPGMRTALRLLFAQPMGTVSNFALAIGLGALAVVILEVLYQQVVMTAGVLWALLLCLLISFWIKSLLPLPTIVVTLDNLRLVGLMMGVFWKGRPYWQRY